MVPPAIRVGAPPLDGNHKTMYVLLVRRKGWLIARFNYNQGFFYDLDAHPHSRHDYRIEGEDILCWMPQDGS